jgi:hypothetical protein
VHKGSKPITQTQSHLLRRKAAATLPNAAAMDVSGLGPAEPSSSAFITRTTCFSTASRTGSATRGLWPLTLSVVAPAKTAMKGDEQQPICQQQCSAAVSGRDTSQMVRPLQTQAGTWRSASMTSHFNKPHSCLRSLPSYC